MVVSSDSSSELSGAITPLFICISELTMSEYLFTNLTPDLILDAIESLGIYPESGLLALNSFENRVYQFLADDGKRYVIKFYRPKRWSNAQIQEEHDFSFELNEAEVPVAAPLRINGQSLFEYQGYRFALFNSVGGRIFEVDNLDQLEVLGRFIGRLHQEGKKVPFQHREAISSKLFLHQAKQDILDSQLVPSSLQSPFIAILDQVIVLTEDKYQPFNEIRLHGDCHAGNILWTGEELIFVDLDDARYGPAIQDLWMMLSGSRSNQVLQLDTLINAYQEFCDFDYREFALIEPLRAMRMINYMAWLAKRWHDPAFQRNFSWFASDKYWEQQILILKEQLAALNEPPLSLLP